MKNCKYCGNCLSTISRNSRYESSFVCEHCRTLFIIRNNKLVCQYNSVIHDNTYYEIRFDLENNRTFIMKGSSLSKVSELNYILTDISPSSLKDKLGTILTLS